MFSIEYKDYGFKIKKINDTAFIFDSIRRKWVVLTPEEWVRQNFIRYLITDLGYPKTVLAVEKQITTFENKSRFDIVVYSTALQPFMIIECKQQKVELNDSVLKQVLNYQATVQCKYIMVTNGDWVAGWDLSDPVKPLEKIPFYNEL
jgi:hypothetical protein